MQDLATTQKREKVKSRFFENEPIGNRVSTVAKTTDKDSIVVDHQLFDNKEINANLKAKARN